jgi:hypothetical protein
MNSKSRKLKQQIVGWTLACCIVASSVATDRGTAQAAPPPATRQQLLELEKEWAAAEDKYDPTVLRRILDERFVATFGAATTYDKEAFIKLFADDVDPTASQALTYEAVIIDVDTAVLVGTDTARGTRDGAMYTSVYKYTATYIRRHGRWRALAEHIVEVPKAK